MPRNKPGKRGGGSGRPASARGGPEGGPPDAGASWTASELAAAIEAWFVANARKLPWRTDLLTQEARDPYVCLVAEAMLQQTQVSRVIGYLDRFLARFPTVGSLAAADEAEVLALWSGLGYYRRAKNLHAAARAVVGRFGGQVPRTVEELLTLPGVGRYTAGAIASIVFNRAEPLVDGNVTRVLLRIDGRDDLKDPKAAQAWAWGRAEELVKAAASPARLNEGLMEHGALVCTPPPSTPACLHCPVQGACRALARGLIDRIPAPKPAKENPVVHCAVLVIRDRQGRLRLEQRPPTGMWASMWQAPTLEGDRPATEAEVRAFAAAKAADPASVRAVGAFAHGATHRTLKFTVYAAEPVECRRKGAAAAWVRPAELEQYGVSNAARRALLMGESGAPAR